MGQAVLKELDKPTLTVHRVVEASGHKSKERRM
jgi:hypothetical protein